MKQISIGIWMLLLLSLQACVSSSNNKPEPTGNVNPAKAYRLLEVEEAKKWVVRDEKEGFFERVQPLEMAIQLKVGGPPANQETMLPTYKKMLQDDLQAFTPSEKKEVERIMEKALELSYKVSANLDLPEIVLIKTKGAYYGPGTFYTRDNAIVIPAPMLDFEEEGSKSVFLSTMIHEIFHIYSRYHTDKRNALYKRIGFDALPNLELSDFLKTRVLYNPDGVDLRYAITVTDNESGRSFEAIPAIYSKFNEYRAEIPVFFGYLMFQLFEVEEKEGIWTVMNPNIGYSVDDVTGFWEQVERNTLYNIHPDEICADNFVILALSKEKGAKPREDLDKDGLTLLKDLEAIIKK